MINADVVKRVIFLVGICSCLCYPSSGQCLGDDSLFAHANFIIDSKISEVQKLDQLLNLEARLKTCPVHDSTHAFLLAQIGKSYSNIGDYLEAIRFVRSAITLSRERKGQFGSNPKYLTACYYYLSTFYAALDNKAERIRALDSCIEVAVKMKFVDYYLLFALFTRSKYAYNIGDYKNCYRYADMTEKFSNEYAKDGDRTKRSYADSYVMSSSVLKSNSLLAMNDFEALRPIYTEQAEDYKKKGANKYLGIIYDHLAEIELQKGNYNNALSYWDTAFSYESKFGTTANCRVILTNLGVMYSLQLKNPHRAIAYYKRAYSYKRPKDIISREDSVEAVNPLTNLGIAYTGLGQFDSALQSFRLAFEQVGSGWNENSFLSSSSQELTSFSKIGYFTKLLIAKGNCYKELYKVNHKPETIKEALRIYLITDKILFRIKTEQSDLSSKLFWRKDTRELYENALGACLLVGNFEDALYFFERSKAILLNDQLNEQRWTAQHDVLKQSQVKKKIIQLERALVTTDKNSPATDSIQKELFTKQQELEEVQNQIKANNPLYFQYYMDTSTFKIQDIRHRLLKDHDALLEMFSGDSSVYLLMIGREKIDLIRLDKLIFDSVSTSFSKYLSNSYLANKEHGKFTHVSSQLYSLIFSKLKIPNGRIIISPDGKYFPFEALVTTVTSGNSHYFVEDHAVSYTYSARFLLNQFDGNSNSSERNFIGVAPVQFASKLGLQSLPGSDESLERLQSHFSRSNNLLNENATRDNFLRSYSRYKIIQLYTHASESGFYKEPVIYFSDSALLLSDLLYEGAPVTSLIVLSACDTGTGKLYQGEGVFSFNRGFAALGIPSSVANLWQVENQSTYKLTELFYQYLAEGVPVDLALQKAKLKFIETSSREKQLPYYWAAPILTGRTDAIELKKSYAWIYAAAGLGVLTFICVALWTRTKRRKDTPHSLKFHEPQIHPLKGE